MKIRERKSYFEKLHLIDQLSQELAIRQNDVSMLFEKKYLDAKTYRRSTLQHIAYALLVILFIILFLYQKFDHILIKIFLVLIGISFMALVFRFLKANKAYQRVKKDWDYEFAIDNEAKKVILEEKNIAASIALKIIVYSENYLYLSQFHHFEEKEDEFKKLLSLYLDSLIQLQTYEDVLAYFNEWEINNS